MSTTPRILGISFAYSNRSLKKHDSLALYLARFLRDSTPRRSITKLDNPFHLNGGSVQSASFFEGRAPLITL